MNGFNRVLRKIRKIVYSLHAGYRVTGERVCPDFPDDIFKNHLEVYEFALQFVQGKSVLDVGCGTGYGSYHLVTHGARRVDGIDYAEDAIGFARKRYIHESLAYHRMDAQHIGFSDTTFDAVFSSENIEHLPDPEMNMREMRRVLKNGGILILGTPNREVSTPGDVKNSNPFHLKEFYYEELEDMVKRHFDSVCIFENSLDSAYSSGREMKRDRTLRGKCGISAPFEGSSLKVGPHIIDVTHLHNTHSFMVIAW